MAERSIEGRERSSATPPIACSWQSDGRPRISRRPQGMAAEWLKLAEAQVD
jgi:hypothetical protein